MLKHIPFDYLLVIQWSKVNVFGESLLSRIENWILDPYLNATPNESFLLESENHF